MFMAYGSLDLCFLTDGVLRKPQRGFHMCRFMYCECIWELPGHIKSNKVCCEISQSVLKFYQFFKGIAGSTGSYCTGKMRTCG